MSYFIRVLAKSDKHVPVAALRESLNSQVPGFQLLLDEGDESEWEQLLLKHSESDEIAVIERNAVTPGSLAEEEIEEFLDDIEDCKPVSAGGWLKGFMPEVKTIYAFQILSGADKWQGWEAVQRVRNEIWSRLGGILQSDDEGFTNEDGYHILWQFSGDVNGSWNMGVLDAHDQWKHFEMDLGNPDRRRAFLNGRIPEGVKVFNGSEDGPSVPHELTNAVRSIVELLVSGDYRQIARTTKGRRLSEDEIRSAVVGYGRTLTLPPPKEFDRLNVIEVEGRIPREWSVTMNLWTEEEGRSDLSIELTVIESAEVVVELDGLHVS